MNGLSIVFLEKSELQHSGISILIDRYSLNLGITERHVPVEVFSKEHRNF